MATGEVIGAILAKCAQALDPDSGFKVVQVEQLATHIINPRTKSWKVTVPYKFASLMDRDEMFPPGWSHRKFFGAPGSGNSGNPAKQARTDDGVVTQVMKEIERKEVEEKQEEEDKKTCEESLWRCGKERGGGL